MPAPETETCPSCRAEVFRAFTSSGVTMLVDRETDPGATVELTMRSGRVMARFAGASKTDPRHRPHIFTCSGSRN